MPILRTPASLFFCLCATAAVSTVHAQQAHGDSVDVLIRGGTVVDGTGAPPRRADVAIRGDRIVFVGDASHAHLRAVRTTDAAGLVVTPGFIDAHTHTEGDLSSPASHGNVSYLMQGVTTVVTGNDGGGSLDIAKTLDTWQRQGIGTNAALFIGEGSVRGHVMGMSDTKPTTAQLDSMRALVARGMNAGALGMSTGLYYAPGSYASTDEVVALARVAAQHGGIYDTHLRDESSYTVGLVGAVSEAIRIGREAHIPIHISHIKALGADVWGQSDTVIALIKRARADGVDVTACQYPYTASGPPCCRAGQKPAAVIRCWLALLIQPRTCDSWPKCATISVVAAGPARCSLPVGAIRAPPGVSMVRRWPRWQPRGTCRRLTPRWTSFGAVMQVWHHST